MFYALHRERPVSLSLWLVVGITLISLLFSVGSSAASTDLKVLVRADDAKYIGSGVGGLNVTIKDTVTGELLSHGVISGGTGDTTALMKKSHSRGRSPVAGDPASFQTALELQRPTRIEISVSGPLDVAQSSQSVSTTLWMIPGTHRVETPVILHMPGLITDLVSYSLENRTLSLTASVTMICGCPITAGGLWDAAEFVAVVQLYQDGEHIVEAPLEFTGNDNEFAGSIKVPDAGDFDMVVYAYQQNTGNTGVYQRPLRVN
ncbi:hypothetical protein CWI75_05305 [Kineobactrum sediminis]|uniref:Uncharacterized protein n=1 Tax=Kineobactrum sediminis TaxID=1905677 RepID=A0A2N5Y5U2_9GAMM|nr:hypothetical protein [Kineobactrum sediminis]PLW83763.1 hypothetical protein CWI75_05305 [Kineobactrum sediminis]